MRVCGIFRNLWEWVDWERGGDVDLAQSLASKAGTELGNVVCQDLNSELYLPLEIILTHVKME